MWASRGGRDGGHIPQLRDPPTLWDLKCIVPQLRTFCHLASQHHFRLFSVRVLQSIIKIVFHTVPCPCPHPLLHCSYLAKPQTVGVNPALCLLCTCIHVATDLAKGHCQWDRPLLPIVGQLPGPFVLLMTVSHSLVLQLSTASPIGTFSQ